MPHERRRSLLTIEDWSCLNARLLWCYEGPVAASSRQGYGERSQLSAWWLRAGSVTIVQDKQTVTARSGEWLFCAAKPLRQHFSDDARILSINFKLEWPSGDAIVDRTALVRAEDFPHLARTARALLRFINLHFPHAELGLKEHPVEVTLFFELQRLFSAWAQTYLKTLLTLDIVPNRMEAIDPRVLDALRRLDRHDWHTPFREKEFARASGLSAGHLDRLFARETGMTPRAYLQKRRREAATAALTDSTKPIKEIAYGLGFSSASNFTHWLRHAAGKSPREIRNG